MDPPAESTAFILPGNRPVPYALIRLSADTHGGPGGQHANRTASRIEAAIAVDELPLTDQERSLLAQRLAARIRSDGTIAARAGDDRRQSRNRKMAVERLRDMILEAIHVDPPRRPTTPSRSALRRRRAARTEHSRRKSARRWRPDSNDDA